MNPQPTNIHELDLLSRENEIIERSHFTHTKDSLLIRKKNNRQISLNGIASEIKIHQNLNVFLFIQISIHWNSLKSHYKLNTE